MLSPAQWLVPIARPVLRRYKDAQRDREETGTRPYLSPDCLTLSATPLPFALGCSGRYFAWLLICGTAQSKLRAWYYGPDPQFVWIGIAPPKSIQRLHWCSTELQHWRSDLVIKAFFSMRRAPCWGMHFLTRSLQFVYVICTQVYCFFIHTRYD